MQYLEIEHKFIVEDDFNFSLFDEKLKSMTPDKTKHVNVVDTYFVLDTVKNHVYRHRFDEEIQQLTIKSCSKDPAVRKEVNLSFEGDNQINSVRNFLDASKISFEGAIEKSVYVYDFPDAEVVYYEATHDSKKVCCIEIEAKKASSIEKAKATIECYEQKIGLDSSKRAKLTLFDLLLKEKLPVSS